MTTSVAKRSDGLLPAATIIRLLHLVHAGLRDAAELASTLRLVDAASLLRTQNTFILLAELGLLEFNEGRVSITNLPADPSNLRRLLRGAIYSRYRMLLGQADLGSAFQMRKSGTELWVDRLQLPFRELGYPYLMIQFDLAWRSGPEERFWRVSEDVKEDLLSLLAEMNSTRRRHHKFSLSDLNRLYAAQQQAGRQAENYVVDFERRRLAHHPFKNLIRSISDEDASAGYDVLSFESEATLIHDRFIEVKSFADDSSFYWSAEEIETARAIADRYWLYLVDRLRMNSQGYMPDMIQDPYTYFLVHKPEGWVIEAKSLKFIRQSQGDMGAES